jgi:hypothetical protein
MTEIQPCGPEIIPRTYHRAEPPAHSIRRQSTKRESLRRRPRIRLLGPALATMRVRLGIQPAWLQDLGSRERIESRRSLQAGLSRLDFSLGRVYDSAQSGDCRE